MSTIRVCAAASRRPNLDWLRKQAKRRLDELRKTNPDAQLADAQFDLAKQYGFPSWRALKAHIDSLTVDGQLFEAARTGTSTRWPRCSTSTRTSCTRAPSRTSGRCCTRRRSGGHLAAVDLLLTRGLDVNTREEGDNTYAMHWAAAAGHLDVVRRLADAGGDVIGHGDDHELEVIGWATCWDGCDDAAHRAIADVSRESRRAAPHLLGHRAEPRGRSPPHRGGGSGGAQHAHEPQREPPAAAAFRRADESSGDGVAAAGTGRRSAGGRWLRASRRRRTRPRRTSIGAVMESDSRDDVGGADQRRARTSARARRRSMDLVAALALGDWETAERLLRENPD